MEKGKEQRKLFHDVVKLIFVRYGTIPLNLVTGILLARALGPNNLGIYTLMMWLPAVIAGPMSLGIGNANLYYAAKEPDLVPSLVANSFWITIISFTVFLACVSGVVVLFPQILPGNITFYHIIIPLFQIPFRFFVMFIQNIFNATDNHKYFRFVELIQQVSYFILCVIGYIFLNIKLWGFVWVRIISTIFPCIFIIIILKKYAWLRFRLKLDLLKNSILYGLKIQFSSIVRQASQKIDELILLKISGATFLGYYTICKNNLNRLSIIPYSLVTVLVPKFSNESKMSLELAARASRIVLWFLLCLILLLIPVLKIIIPLFYGVKYIPVVFPLQIMLFLLLPIAVQRVISFYLMMNNYVNYIIKCSIISAITLILGDLIFIYFWGLLGAIFATFIAYLLESSLLILFFKNKTGLLFREILVPSKKDIDLLIGKFLKK